jgi:hypothetical protein
MKRQNRHCERSDEAIPARDCFVATLLAKTAFSPTSYLLLPTSAQ